MNENVPSLATGTKLAGRYELIGEVGRGGFGTIYRASQLNIDREVAIKTLPPQFMAIPDVVERFRREAQLASRLRHPNTITIHDYGAHDDFLFIVMELLHGQDLADLLQREKRLSITRLVHIAQQVLRSLSEAHTQGIVHRDLKPENIFLTTMGEDNDFVKVLDFGIAKLAMPESATAQDGRSLTISGSTVGTPTYMSPEQAAGEEVDARTDIYALGVIMYEMACGRPPFQHENPVQTMRSHLFESVPPLPDPSLRGTLLERVILRALEKEQDDRFQSASEFLEALSTTSNYMTPMPGMSSYRHESGNFDEDIAFEETGQYQAAQRRNRVSSSSSGSHKSASVMTVLEPAPAEDDIVVLTKPKKAGRLTPIPDDSRSSANTQSATITKPDSPQKPKAVTADDDEDMTYKNHASRNITIATIIGLLLLLIVLVLVF